METANTSETSINFYQTTRCNIPHDSHLQCWWDICGCSDRVNLPSWRQCARCFVRKWWLVRYGAEWFIYGLLNDAVNSSDNRPEVLRVMTTFWFVTPCGLVRIFQRFGGTYCLHLRDETLVSTYKTIRRHYSEHQHWHWFMGSLVKNELERAFNEAVVDQFKVLSRNLPLRTEENGD
jgi:hypothetical protein